MVLMRLRDLLLEAFAAEDVAEMAKAIKHLLQLKPSAQGIAVSGMPQVLRDSAIRNSLPPGADAMGQACLTKWHRAYREGVEAGTLGTTKGVKKPMAGLEGMDFKSRVETFTEWVLAL